jgi:hypothetical protein
MSKADPTRLAEKPPPGARDDHAARRRRGLPDFEPWDDDDEPDDTLRRMERAQRRLRERFRQE